MEYGAAEEFAAYRVRLKNKKKTEPDIELRSGLRLSSLINLDLGGSQPSATVSMYANISTGVWLTLLE